MENITAQVALIPWTEYVGKVVSIEDNAIILQVIRHIPIILPADVCRKSQSILKKGQQVGVLILDNGGIRIRPAQLQQLDLKGVITN